jgi:hypothetical protein
MDRVDQFNDRACGTWDTAQRVAARCTERLREVTAAVVPVPGCSPRPRSGSRTELRAEHTRLTDGVLDGPQTLPVCEPVTFAAAHFDPVYDLGGAVRAGVHSGITRRYTQKSGSFTRPRVIMKGGRHDDHSESRFLE